MFDIMDLFLCFLMCAAPKRSGYGPKKSNRAGSNHIQYRQGFVCARLRSPRMGSEISRDGEIRLDLRKKLCFSSFFFRVFTTSTSQTFRLESFESLLNMPLSSISHGHNFPFQKMDSAFLISCISLYKIEHDRHLPRERYSLH